MFPISFGPVGPEEMVAAKLVTGSRYHRAFDHFRAPRLWSEGENGHCCPATFEEVGWTPTRLRLWLRVKR